MGSQCAEELGDFEKDLEKGISKGVFGKGGDFGKGEIWGIGLRRRNF